MANLGVLQARNQKHLIEERPILRFIRILPIYEFPILLQYIRRRCGSHAGSVKLFKDGKRDQSLYLFTSAESSGLYVVETSVRHSRPHLGRALP